MSLFHTCWVCLFVCAHVGTCLTCTRQATQHGSASTLSTSGSCSWCKTAETSSSVAREVTDPHKHTHISGLTLFTHDVKPPYLAFRIKRLVDVMRVWGSRGKRESQLPLRRTSSLFAFPSPSPPSPACSTRGPCVYFFMNVWIRWKWGSIGFGFGFQGLTCYCTRTHTNSLSHSHTASQMDWNN